VNDTSSRGEQILAALADSLTRLLAESYAGRETVATDDILRLVVDAIAQRLPVTCVAVLMKSDLETLRVVHADVTNPGMNDFLDRYIARMLRPAEVPTHGLSQKVIETGGPVLIPRIKVDQLQAMASDVGRQYAAEAGRPINVDYVGMLMVPMRVGPGIIGTLSLYDWGAHDTLTQADLDWVQRAADRVGIAIDSAVMRNVAMLRRERIAALTDVALAITSGQELRVTFMLILDRALSNLHVDAADILLVDEDEGGMTVAAGTGFRSGFNAEIRGHMPSEAGKRWVIEHNIGSPSTMDWIGQSRRWMLAREGLRSYTAAPLMAGQRFAGALEIFSRNELEPEEEWLSFLDAMAALAAIALKSWTADESRGRVPDSKAAARIAAPDLSEREMEILRMVVDGASNRDVAEKLHLSENTIKFHIRQLLEKSGAANRTELATKAVQQGWV
jgi:DNA-binding CsgD family transcriptional regulator/GAF domain-containing protein